MVSDDAIEAISPLEPTNELEWLLLVSSESSAGMETDELLMHLLEASVERLGCLMGALIRPTDRPILAHSHASRALDRQMRKPLLRLELSLLEHASQSYSTGTDGRMAQEFTEAGFKILIVPLTSRLSPGYLLFVRAPEASEFVSDERHLAQHLSREATALLDTQFDSATGLFTRSTMQGQAERWAAAAGTAHYVICVNIDRLHVINETAGFQAGDRVIAEVAKLLKPARLPQDALSARIGGNEFAVTLPHTELRLAENFARALQASVATIGNALPGTASAISVSGGIASFLDPATEFAHALSLAEVACNTAKERGRGRVEVYSEDDNSMVRRRTDAMTLGRLREALRHDRLTLYAQKIAPLHAGGRTGYELLLRDLDDDQRVSAPAWLFSAAQRYQLEPAVDMWVIEHAIKIASQFRAELFAAQISLSINISGNSIVDEVLLERVKHWVRQSSLASGLITFEITETAALSSIPKALAFIRELRALGCRFALDDFGVGVNSLKHLKSLTADRVKIDGSFVVDVLTNTQSEATIRAIATLAREMRMETVAECAESPQVIARLRELGVDYVQGYAVHRPGPFLEVLENLRAEQSARQTHPGLESWRDP